MLSNTRVALLPAAGFCLVALAVPYLHHLHRAPREPGDLPVTLMASLPKVAVAANGAAATAASDRTLAGYDEARLLIEAGQEEAAAALLTRLRDKPLLVVPSTPSDPAGAAPTNIGSSALLIRVGTALCRHARSKAVAGGDPRAALAWVERTRAIAAHALDGGAAMGATMDTLLTAHVLDRKAAVAESDILSAAARRSPGVFTAHARAAESARKTLDQAYRTTIWPHVIAARESREAAESAARAQAMPAGRRGCAGPSSRHTRGGRRGSALCRHTGPALRPGARAPAAAEHWQQR